MAVDIVHPRVAGIDVHKKVIWVAVRLPGAESGQRKVAVKSFKTFWRSLQKTAAWLAELGVTDLAMESTPVIRGNEDQRRCCRRSRPHVRVGDGKGKSGIDERSQRDELCCRLSACRRLPR